jgi:hypothetical protein
MKKLLLVAASAAGALALSSPASAAITFCIGAANTCGGQGATVHLDGLDDGTDHLVNGTIAAGTIGVLITGNENIKVDQNGGGQGQAWVVPVDGLFNTLDFALASGYHFSHIEFDLNAPKSRSQPVPWTVTLTGYDASNTGFNHTFSNITNNSFFNVNADGGDVLTHVSFSSTSDMIGVGHIRIDGAAPDLVAAPEPTTWALMIMGFGGAGAMLRRRRTAVA